MLAETIPESEFGYPNSVLAKTAPSFWQASRSFSALVSPRRYCRLVREIATLSPGRGIFSLSAHSVVKVQLQLRKSSRWPPSSLGVYFERLLCYNATIRVCIFCCRYPNVSNLCFQFVWRMDIIYFRNSYCRIGGAKNE